MNFQDLLTLMIFIFNIEERLKYLPKCEHGTHKTSNLSKVLAPSCISMIEIDLFVKFEFEYCIIATIIIAIRKVCNFIVAISLLNFVEVSKCSIYITSMIIDIYIKLIKFILHLVLAINIKCYLFCFLHLAVFKIITQFFVSAVDWNDSFRISVFILEDWDVVSCIDRVALIGEFRDYFNYKFIGHLTSILLQLKQKFRCQAKINNSLIINLTLMLSIFLIQQAISIK